MHQTHVLRCESYFSPLEKTYIIDDLLDIFTNKYINNDSVGDFGVKLYEIDMTNF